MSVVYTGGTFDLLHWGHIRFLYSCKKLAGKDGLLIVGLNNDQFVESFKKVDVHHSYKERERNLSMIGIVDYIVENVGNASFKPTYEKFFSTYSNLFPKPDIMAISTDWATKDYYKQMGITQDWLDGHNIVLVYIPHTIGISSTILRKVKEMEDDNIRDT